MAQSLPTRHSNAPKYLSGKIRALETLLDRQWKSTRQENDERYYIQRTQVPNCEKREKREMVKKRTNCETLKTAKSQTSDKHQKKNTNRENAKKRLMQNFESAKNANRRKKEKKT